MKIRFLAAATVVVAALAVAGPVQAATTNSFENGSFQCAGCTPNGSFVDLTAGSTALTDASGTTEWAVTTGSVDWIDGYWSGPNSSNPYSIDLNGTDPGAIAQTFATTAGATYIVSFQLSGNPDGLPDTKTLDLNALGNAPTQYSFTLNTSTTNPTTHLNMGWVPETYTFTATSDSTTLTFASDSTGAYGPVIADVAVAPTTPPESVSVTCSGNCQVQVQSPSTGVTGGVAPSSTGSAPFRLSAGFGTGTLSCDRFVSGSATADPLAVTTTASTGQTVGGSVTLTFPQSSSSHERMDGDTRYTPVCFGATQRFPTWLPVRGSSTYPYQGLLFSCGNPIYKFLVRFFPYPLQACVSSTSWVNGAEQVVVQTSSFGGDPMYW